MKPNNLLTPDQQAVFINILKTRFEKNLKLHSDLNWADVEARLENNPTKIWSLQQMESTSGEPDVIGQDKKTGEYIFCDCSPETPVGRRSICYDNEALQSRKENKPKNSAMGMAQEMGIKILTEEEYRNLQQLIHVDSKTSSWLEAPANIRKLGGAIFGDFRFGRVFVYHNGAESYYAGRGFRGILKV